MDKVFIEGLQMEAVIGVYEWERSIRQKLVLDLEMDWDNSIPAKSEKLEHALDYDRLSRRIIEYVSESQFELIETLAEHIAQIILTEFRVPAVSLTLHKPGAVKAAESVGVKISRTHL